MNDGYNNKKVGLWTWLNKVSPWPLTYPIHMTRNESRYFTSWVKPSQYYLEFGCGGSTIKALKCSRALVYSVESNQSWLDELLSYRFMRIQAENRWKYFHIDIGETREWGYPMENAEQHLFPAYSSFIFDQIDPHSFDRVLIDGRFRVACILQTILHGHQKPDLQIMVHDIWFRPSYHIVLDFLIEQHRIDSLGVFTIRKSPDLEKIRSLYAKYKFLPN